VVANSLMMHIATAFAATGILQEVLLVVLPCLDLACGSNLVV
jgi:hypothetical protein